MSFIGTDDLSMWDPVPNQVVVQREEPPMASAFTSVLVPTGGCLEHSVDTLPMVSRSRGAIKVLIKVGDPSLGFRDLLTLRYLTVEGRQRE